MKILKNLLLILSFIGLPLLLLGQLKHELKIVPLDLFSIYTPSYELIFNERIGIELGTSYGSKEFMLFDGTILGNNFSTESFDRKLFIPSISGKFYFSSKKNGSGFNIGPHVKFTFNTFVEDTFEKAYIQKYNTDLPYWGRKGFQSFNAGFIGGYKWVLIKERFIIEPSYIGTLLIARRDNELRTSSSIDLDFEIRIGYRF